jgi:hypothetical protein
MTIHFFMVVQTEDHSPYAEADAMVNEAVRKSQVGQITMGLSKKKAIAVHYQHSRSSRK